MEGNLVARKVLSLQGSPETCDQSRHQDSGGIPRPGVVRVADREWEREQRDDTEPEGRPEDTQGHPRRSCTGLTSETLTTSNAQSVRHPDFGRKTPKV